MIEFNPPSYDERRIWDEVHRKRSEELVRKIAEEEKRLKEKPISSPRSADYDFEQRYARKSNFG